MGAIQSSVNQAVGLAAGVKVAKDQLDTTGIKEALDIQYKMPQLESDIAKQTEAVETATVEEGRVRQGYEKELKDIATTQQDPTTTDQDWAAAETRKEDINIDIKKYKTAIETAQAKLDAMNMQRDYYRVRFAKITGGKR